MQVNTLHRIPPHIILCMNSVVCRLLQRVLHPPKSPHWHRRLRRGAHNFDFFRDFLRFFSHAKNRMHFRRLFFENSSILPPPGDPKIEKNRWISVSAACFVCALCFPSFFYRFLAFFYNFHGSARCVFSAFLQRLRACRRPVSLWFAEMRHSRIYREKQYEINIFKVPLFSRFSSWNVFLCCFSRARPSKKCVFFTSAAGVLRARIFIDFRPVLAPFSAPKRWKQGSGRVSQKT